MVTTSVEVTHSCLHQPRVLKLNNLNNKPNTMTTSKVTINISKNTCKTHREQNKTWATKLHLNIHINNIMNRAMDSRCIHNRINKTSQCLRLSRLSSLLISFLSSLLSCSPNNNDPA